MYSTNADKLITWLKAFVKADQDRMASRPYGMPRAHWRELNPIVDFNIAVLDTAYKTRPTRCFAVDLASNPYDLYVWSTGRTPRCIERIDLRKEDANTRLARYLVKGPA
jgi:hypothetical protein